MDTFAVITTESNELLAERTRHDRMPVMIRRQDYQRWLEPGSDAQPPIDLIRPFDSDRMKAWRVDRRINNVKINEHTLCESLGADDPGPEQKQRKFKGDESG